MNMWQGWSMEYALVYDSTNTDMHTTLDSLNKYNMGGYFQPDTLNFLSAIGRVTIHEAETNYESTTPYYYQNHTATLPGGGSYKYGVDLEDNWNSTTQKVRYYDKTTWQSGSDHSPVVILSGINENLEQSFMTIPSQSPVKSRFWFLRPRMRIPVSALSNPDDVVVKIIYRAYDGSVIKEQEILVRNFLNSGIYSGNYIESFKTISGDELNLSFPSGQYSGDSLNINKGHPGLLNKDYFWEYNSLQSNCHVDYEIQWYGKVDVYIDYVKVMDQGAYDLFYNELTRKAVVTETRKLLNYGNGGANITQGFYTEEIQYCNIECLKELKKILTDSFPSQVNNVRLVSLYNPISYAGLLKSRDVNLNRYRKYLNEVQPPRVMFVDYCFRGGDAWLGTRLPGNITLDFGTNQYPYGNVIQTRISGTYNAFKTTKEVYNTYLQDTIWRDNRKFLIDMGNLCRENNKNIEMDYVPQIISWDHNTGGQYFREPMNSELTALFCISLCYGVKGIMPYAYESFTEHSTNIPAYPNLHFGSTGPQGTQVASPEYFFTFGMTDVAYSVGVPLQDDFKWGEKKRTNNFYGENKWEAVKDLFGRLDKWGKVIANSTNTEGYSVSVDGAQHKFINNISSKTTDNSINNNCSNSDSYDCPDEQYWEMGFFTPDYLSENDKGKYFMMVNKRCIPEAGGYNGDKRILKIQFKTSELTSFNNWKLTDINTGSFVTFDKNSQGTGGFVDLGSALNSLGYFLPGEGKMFKLAPVMQEGGILVTHENFSNVIFNCNGSVTANVNKNITIGGNVTIYFKDSVVISMSGGNFKCGPYTESYAPQKSVNLLAQTGMQWAGLSFMNVDTVIIHNTEFQNVKSIYDLNEGYSLDLINSKVINIDGCSITNTNATASAAGVHINYVTNLYMTPDINITNNVIKISTSDGDGVYIHPYSWLTMTPYIYRNKIISTSSGGGEFGIFGFDLEGTAIKENYIENFENGIQTWYSSIDLFENTIDTKNIWNGFPLNGIVSEYNLSNAYESRLGGSNVLTTLDGQCIHLDALDLNISNGNNILNIRDSLAYHLAGYFPVPLPSNYDPPPHNGIGNCFQIAGNPVFDASKIRENVTWLDLVGVEFDFSEPSCPESPNYCDYYIGGNPNDTVWIECAGGMGGGQRSYELSVAGSQAKAPQENVYKQIYDSLSINMRKRQYELASQKCMTLLNNYPDSTKTINAVDKLYHTALARDEVNELKSYYESFIQSHPNHAQIIQRMFYYIQKAKARLGQYESAMQGFQTIMNQFPTSYEGLAAKWDYMATQLLDSLSGQGGSEKETISDEQLTEEQRHERLVSLVEDPLDKYDKKKFTKEDREVIVNNIVNSFEDRKTKETKRVKELEVKVFMNEATKSEKQEYKTKKVLKEVVRPQTVNTISEHINAVQSDIEKVFDVGKNTKDVDNKTVAVIPLEYKLNQNYPNPFNPSTKINYELKNAGYVSLKIYDLLGREIAELVNETKDAGRYTIDFNASKYMMASGIYFYRIKAGNFVDTKRMVLVK